MGGCANESYHGASAVTNISTESDSRSTRTPLGNPFPRVAEATQYRQSALVSGFKFSVSVPSLQPREFFAFENPRKVRPLKFQRPNTSVSMVDPNFLQYLQTSQAPGRGGDGRTAKDAHGPRGRIDFGTRGNALAWGVSYICTAARASGLMPIWGSRCCRAGATNTGVDDGGQIGTVPSTLDSGVEY